MAAALKGNEFQKGPTMTTLDLDTLTQVTGGTTTNDALTQSLTAIQSSLTSLASSNNNNQNNTLLPMVMMMAMRRR
jgi:hypothetical protein